MKSATFFYKKGKSKGKIPVSARTGFKKKILFFFGFVSEFRSFGSCAQKYTQTETICD